MVKKSTLRSDEFFVINRALTMEGGIMGETNQALAVLRDARAMKMPWADVAGALQKLELSHSTDPSGRTWAQIAADLSGYAESQLRRMTTILSYVQSTYSRTKLKDENMISSLPLSHLDVVFRISRFNEEKAVDILNSIDRSGKLPMTYRLLLDTLDVAREQSSVAPSPRVDGMRFARQFRDRSFALLSSCAVLEVGPEDRLVRRRYDHRYANPDFLILRRTGVIEGIDYHALQGSSQKDLVIKRVLHTATEASFFDRFWIVLPIDHASEFESECRQLGLANVGLIVVDDQVSKILRSSNYPTATPYPDRRVLWRQQARLERP